MEAVPRKDRIMRDGAWDMAVHPTNTCRVLRVLKAILGSSKRPHVLDDRHLQQGWD